MVSIKRRQFLAGMSTALVGSHMLGAFNPAIAEELAQDRRGPLDVAADEKFWFQVQQAFTVDRSLMNLNNGGVCPSPASVQEAMKRYLDFSNHAPTYTMWRILEPQRETVRDRLARHFGCSSEEIALTRNASEGLQICELGFDLKSGDEVLTTDQDYPRMITTFQQRERREGIVLKQFPLPVPAEDDEVVVDLFRRHITPKTKLILMCHMINLTGQILPVKKVVQMARQRGIPVIVDGAHAFGHFDFKLQDLDCDYYATSLHKWLLAPHGTGMLYVRKDKIRDLWAMMPAHEKLDDDIRKYEEIGTHPAANYLAIGEALAFHEGIGPARKEARLRYLTHYWAKRLKVHGKVKLNTSLLPKYSCALCNFNVEGIDMHQLGRYLMNGHRIITTPIDHGDCRGMRITPNLYTTIAELDRFCDIVENVIKKGLPS
ncbi:MAG: aminotransferase class V-fold PLP-dependent enzyme [Acidobacteriota bacterium]|nr:aminotransferase class V-fold PLP-dependent enzyme [Acidobacteriota bacterium]